tara:strand:- start:1810 stop:1959 length:150 start_codon:yes stop_codon:yes gene_type:complete
MKSRAADNAALRARRAKAGLICYRAWVTPQEKIELSGYLEKLRKNKIKG